MSSLVWDVSPILADFGMIKLRYYSLLFALSVFIGFQICVSIISREKSKLDADKLFLYIFFGLIIGARLGHVLFYNPSWYLSNPVKIFKVWEGGLASHGAFIGISVSILLFCRNYRFPVRYVLDLIFTVLGICFLVRIGNFFNSEIIGAPADVPWAVIFTSVDNIPRHPAQLYEAAGYLLTLIIVYSMYRFFNVRPGSLGLFRTSLLLAFSTRFIVEFFKENQVNFESTLPINMGQILSIPFILFSLYLFFYKPNPLPENIFYSEQELKKLESDQKKENLNNTEKNIANSNKKKPSKKKR